MHKASDVPLGPRPNLNGRPYAPHGRGRGRPRRYCRPHRLWRLGLRFSCSWRIRPTLTRWMPQVEEPKTWPLLTSTAECCRLGLWMPMVRRFRFHFGFFNVLLRGLGSMRAENSCLISFKLEEKRTDQRNSFIRFGMGFHSRKTSRSGPQAFWVVGWAFAVFWTFLNQVVS